MNRLCITMFVITLACQSVRAQDTRTTESMPGMKVEKTQTKEAPAPCVEDMPGMQMCPKAPTPKGKATSNDAMQEMKIDGGMKELMDGMEPQTFLQQIRHHASSGTSAEPNSTPAPMLMTMKDHWMLMFHSNIFVTDLQQTSQRGGDKLFSTNWFMPMAERVLGPGQLTLRAMFSLEPATITNRQYPLLFQQGETAFGKPITDGQHPHDFLMEIAALYDLKLNEKTLLSFYVAPVGDPAIGPTAYPHRASASENPVATLGHHQQDSTHIAESRLRKNRFLVDAANAATWKELERPVLIRSDRRSGGSFPGGEPGPHDSLSDVQPALRQRQLGQHTSLGQDPISGRQLEGKQLPS
jgi:hypothetical protein